MGASLSLELAGGGSKTCAGDNFTVYDGDLAAARAVWLGKNVSAGSGYGSGAVLGFWCGAENGVAPQEWLRASGKVVLSQ